VSELAVLTSSFSVQILFCGIAGLVFGVAAIIVGAVLMHNAHSDPMYEAVARCIPSFIVL
jgi:hypothetical protein